jgi:hypothetical protein
MAASAPARQRTAAAAIMVVGEGGPGRSAIGGCAGIRETRLGSDVRRVRWTRLRRVIGGGSDRERCDPARGASGQRAADPSSTGIAALGGDEATAVVRANAMGPDVEPPRDMAEDPRSDRRRQGRRCTCAAAVRRPRLPREDRLQRSRLRHSRLPPPAHAAHPRGLRSPMKRSALADQGRGTPSHLRTTPPSDQRRRAQGMVAPCAPCAAARSSVTVTSSTTWNRAAAHPRTCRAGQGVSCRRFSTLRPSAFSPDSRAGVAGRGRGREAG